MSCGIHFSDNPGPIFRRVIDGAFVEIVATSNKDLLVKCSRNNYTAVWDLRDEECDYHALSRKII